MRRYLWNNILLFIVMITMASLLNAQEKKGAGAEELANKLSNPVAGLVSVPFQSNIDYGIGNYNGSNYTLNVQPVVPISLSPNLNLITRYIIPIVDQHDVTGEGED